MKTLTIGAIFVLLTVGIGALAQSALADHATATVDMPEGTILPGCEVDDMCFVPADVTIDVGGEVTWTNSDTAGHTIESGTTTEGSTELFGTGYTLMPPGEEYTFKFDDFEPGTYPYFCLVHPWMEGTVTVVAAAADEDKMMDDHGDGMEHGDGMAMMIEEPSGTGMVGDAEVLVKTGVPAAGEQLEVTVQFVDKEHVNYDVMVTQGGETVLDDTGAHEHEGTGTHMTAPLESDDPVDITVTFQGYGIEQPYEGGDAIGQEVTFAQVVPEFGTIAMIILGVAITSIIAITARSRIMPKI